MSTAATDLRWVPRADDFAMRLAMVRQRMGWNAKEAALACGFPQASWREWEVFGRVPRNIIDVADAISARTGVDDYWLITGRESDHGPAGSDMRARRDSNSQPSDP